MSRKILRLAKLLAVSIVSLVPSGETSAQAPRLTIERLYSLPRIIGTPPRSFAWSSDGRHLAFLWNDEGRNFRDVWVLDTAAPDQVPTRVTHLPHLDPLSGPTLDPVAAAESEERAERDPGVTAVTWHPDGRRLLITFRGDLWLVTPDGQPRRLTDTPALETQAAYSPAGDLLAFLTQGELWLMAADPPAAASGTPAAVRRIDSISPDVGIASFRWSPTGSRIAVLERDRRDVALRGIPDYLSDETRLVEVRRAYPGELPARQRLGFVSARSLDSREPVQWVELDEGPASPESPWLLLSYAWAPDGERLAVDTSDLYAKDRRIFQVDVRSASPPAARIVVRERDPLNETYYYWRIAWSTDSRHLYFLSDRDQDYHVYALATGREGLEASEPRRLTRGDWAVAEMHPVEGGLIVVGNRGRPEERQLFRVDDPGGEVTRVSHRPGTHAPTLSPDGRYAAVAFSSDTTPPELLLTTLDPVSATSGPEDGLAVVERLVTDSPTPEFSGYAWVAPQYVTFRSHVDGTELHGRLTLPPDFDPDRRYPAILGSVYTESVRNQWGGRTAHPTWGLDQYLAQQGYVLLNVDVRGSWGRGRDHRRGIRLDYGGMDIEDLESGVRFLEGEGYVDMGRVGIWGSSYGGLMTVMSLFRKPGLYAAGVAGAPATNVWHALTGQMAVMMAPEDQAEAYADSSPFLHAEGLEDPLMIIHGMRDQIVLFKDTATLVQRLIMLGKDVDLVALPNAGHGWDNEGLAQTRFAFGKLVQHFERHLGGERR
jgi:dipeptidyl-peptidase-4